MYQELYENYVILKPVKGKAGSRNEVLLQAVDVHVKEPEHRESV